MSELTPMQSACWFGRSSNATLGGVSAHLYAEFNHSGLDLQKLNAALHRLYQHHQLLRLSLSNDGVPMILPDVQHELLHVEDFSLLDEQQQQQKLLQKREQWTHQQLDLAHGQTARFSVSILKDKICRFHIDTDMIAIDPSSFCRLMEDLALFYDNLEYVPPPTPNFFEWYDQVRADPDLKKLRHRDRLWWKDKLPTIAPAPTLPYVANPQQVKSYRLSTWLQPEEKRALQQLARTQRITLSSLVLGVFAYSLAKVTNDRAFRLNLPLFWREPLVNGIEHCVGDFANVVIVNVQLEHADTLATLCQQLADQLIDLLEHSHYSGVNILRDLSRHHGCAQLAPVVFTAALDLAEENLFSERVHRVFGAMDWVISQGSQVALDAQVANLNGGVLINWDIRLDALPLDWVNNLFDTFSGLLKNVAADPQQLNSTIDHEQKHSAATASAEHALNALQQAYLLGRTTTLALGGVAMQEFRQYHGRMDSEVLKQRLTEMVQRHASLRTYIDPHRLVSYVSERIVLNLTEIDLSQLPPEHASAQIRDYKEHYTHALFDLKQSPWNITVFILNHHLLTVFVRFDALILDGRCIASLMLELFTGQQHDVTSSSTSSPSENNLSARTSDMQYWETKLAQMTGTAQLPWKTALASIQTSRYQRKSLCLAKEQFKQFAKIGAKQALFKNSLIMALILEVLSNWSTEPAICVAIPTLPLYAGPFSNSSTFIAVEWQQADHFTEQATHLQTDVLEALQHLSFSGVDLARLLFEKTGSAPVLPIVITNGLSWPVLSDSNPMQLQDGLTQTPQVALDIRFHTLSDGALVIAIDYAEEAISSTLIDDFLEALHSAIQQIIRADRLTFDLEQQMASLRTQRPYFQQNGLGDQPFRAQTPAATHSQRKQLWGIYLHVLGHAQEEVMHELTAFRDLGLRPHHLKTISKQINTTFAIQLSPAQLIHCRTIADVEQLIASC